MLSLIQRMRDRWLDFPYQDSREIGQDRYRIEHVIGMGSYGIAYLAKQTEKSMPCLIKQSRPSKKEKGRELLRREAEFLKRMNHDRVPQCMDYFVEGRDECLVMTYIQGSTVEQLLFEEKRPFTEAEALLFIRELGQLVCAVHQASIVHLDVRIPNVLVRAGELYLIDFGLAETYEPEAVHAVQQQLGERGRRTQRKTLFAARTKQEDDLLKQQMRAPLYSSDWFAVGHLLLFILYSSYMEEDEQEEHPWEELDLHPATVNLLNLLLQRESEDDAVYQRHIEQACEALEVSRYSLKQALCGPNVQSKVDTPK